MARIGRKGMNRVIGERITLIWIQVLEKWHRVERVLLNWLGTD
jgi:hypothetical protein